MVAHFCQGIGISKSLVGCYPCLCSRKSSSLETYVPNCCSQYRCRESFAEREEVISASRGQFSEMRYSFDSFYKFPVYSVVKDGVYLICLVVSRLPCVRCKCCYILTFD